MPAQMAQLQWSTSARLAPHLAPPAQAQSTIALPAQALSIFIRTSAFLSALPSPTLTTRHAQPAFHHVPLAPLLPICAALA